MISQLSGQNRPSELEKELTHSLTDIAEDLEHALRRQQEVERRLREALREKDRLNARFAQANAELANVRSRWRSEIADLQSQLAESSTTNGRRQAELVAREKLLRDEFERKLQALQIALKQERHQANLRLTRMNDELSTCICRQTMELAQRR
jgi:hypothetical protein